MTSANLLFITSNRLGDAAISTGVLEVARKRLMTPDVTIACGPLPAPLFAGVPGLKRLIVLDKKKGGLHWPVLWLKTIGTYWDAVVDIRNSAVSYLVLAKKVYRFPGGPSGRQKAEQLAGMMGSLPSFGKIWLTKEAEEKAAVLLPAQGPVLALCPTANWSGKQWPAEKFVEAARRLTEEGELKGAAIAVFAAPGEEGKTASLAAGLSRTHKVHDLTGKTDPLEAAACLARCNLCLANDSGLMHIAATMGIPTLGLFGPSNDAEYRPFGPRAGFIRGASFLGMDKTEDYAALMQAIGVDEAVEAAKALLDNG